MTDNTIDSVSDSALQDDPGDRLRYGAQQVTHQAEQARLASVLSLHADSCDEQVAAPLCTTAISRSARQGVSGTAKSNNRVAHILR